MSKKKNKQAKADEPKVALIAGGDEQASSKKGKKGKKAGSKGAATDGKHGGLDSLFKLAEHPLVADLIAVGALAAVAAIAEAGRDEPGAVKSAKAAKSAGKAAAAAIGARLLKEVTSSKKAG